MINTTYILTRICAWTYHLEIAPRRGFSSCAEDADSLIKTLAILYDYSLRRHGSVVTPQLRTEINHLRFPRCRQKLLSILFPPRSEHVQPDR